MSTQPHLLNVSEKITDVVYTPPYVARWMVDHFIPTGRVLDPCVGEWEFYKHLPAGSSWCEITRGRDFFAWSEPVDWIIGNPPYAVFSKWLRHSFTLANDIAYLIPANKCFNSYRMMKEILEWGGIVEVAIIAPGSKLNFPIGFAIAAVHFQRGYKGKTNINIANTGQ